MSLSLSSRIAALSWAAFAAAPFAIGQDAPPPLPEDSVPITKLDTTVVTASREEEEAIEAPYLVERITEAELVERAARTLPEALERVPGVIVQKTAHSQGSPIIRGLTGYHNLVLIDGVRLNDATFRSGPNEYWNTVDSQGLRAIELVKSQGSVLFGSDAVGGTLQALTRQCYLCGRRGHPHRRAVVFALCHGGGRLHPARRDFV
ncbi:MAG: TonB-dependent receptor plug domain-containing protein [Verrucomicrobiales bacterium]